jgi:quercetin dioxygenase-like cupin family protein
MANFARRQTLMAGLGAVSAFILGTREEALAAVGDETKIAEGVTVKTLGEGKSMIQGYPKVRLREVTVQPGSSFPLLPMKNNMVCHMAEGELQIDQGDMKFTVKKGDVWTCIPGGKEGGSNSGSTVAVMRISDLLTT